MLFSCLHLVAGLEQFHRSRLANSLVHLTSLIRGVPLIHFTTYACSLLARFLSVAWSLFWILWYHFRFQSIALKLLPHLTWFQLSDHTLRSSQNHRQLHAFLTKDEHVQLIVPNTPLEWLHWDIVSLDSSKERQAWGVYRECNSVSSLLQTLQT